MVDSVTFCTRQVLPWMKLRCLSENSELQHDLAHQLETYSNIAILGAKPAAPSHVLRSKLSSTGCVVMLEALLRGSAHLEPELIVNGLSAAVAMSHAITTAAISRGTSSSSEEDNDKLSATYSLLITCRKVMLLRWSGIDFQSPSFHNLSLSLRALISDLAGEYTDQHKEMRRVHSVVVLWMVVINRSEPLSCPAPTIRMFADYIVSDFMLEYDQRLLLKCSNLECTNVSGLIDSALKTHHCPWCKYAGYCSKACQKQDWKLCGIHSRMCVG